MSREITFRYIAEHAVRRVILPELDTASRRIESLAEQMLNGENPEINKQRLDEIVDACFNIRAHVDQLK